MVFVVIVAVGALLAVGAGICFFRVKRPNLEDLSVKRDLIRVLEEVTQLNEMAIA